MTGESKAEQMSMEKESVNGGIFIVKWRDESKQGKLQTTAKHCKTI